MLPPVLPLFDSIEWLEEGNPTINQHLTQLALNLIPDVLITYQLAVDWLLEQRFNENNYKTYRSELTTFLHWCFDVEKISIIDVSRKTMQRYVNYCQQPPKILITHRNVAQFVLVKEWSERIPNPLWRPFLGKLQDGELLPYRLSDKALKTKIAILSSFYNYLICEEFAEKNPAMMWMRHSQFASKPTTANFDIEEENIKSFSELQWSYVISAAEKLANDAPDLHERTLFLISLMYSCYLRISEVAAKPGFSPVMGQFRRDSHTGVWGFLIPISKGGKRRTVAASNQLLNALKRYRQHLGLTDLPTINDATPLFMRHKPAGRGRDAGLRNANLGIRQLRDEVNLVIQFAADLAAADGFAQDANEIRQMTPHSIRHTGITHDINLNGRPLAHVQADAGHDSIDTTSQYLHTTKTERHESAAHKQINRLQGID